MKVIDSLRTYRIELDHDELRKLQLAAEYAIEYAEFLSQNPERSCSLENRRKGDFNKIREFLVSIGN